MSHHGDASSTGLGFRIREPHSSGTRGQVEGALGVQVHRANDVATHRVSSFRLFSSSRWSCYHSAGLENLCKPYGPAFCAAVCSAGGSLPDAFTVPGSHRSATPPNCQARFHSAEVRSDVQPVSGKSEAPSVCWGLQGGGSVHVEWNARGLLQAGSEVSADRLHEVG